MRREVVQNVGSLESERAGVETAIQVFLETWRELQLDDIEMDERKGRGGNWGVSELLV